MKKRFRNHFIPHEGNDYKPHFVRERNLIGVGLLVVAIFGLAFSVKNLVTKNPDILSAVITAVLVDLTNSNRSAQHLAPLEFNPVLASAAQLKANDMAEKSYFAHTSPEGKTPWYWFKEGGYRFIYAGENLAVNFIDSEDVVQAWMRSEGHRANILSDKFSEIGIAMAPGKYNGQDTIYVVQLFGTPAPIAKVRAPVVVKEKSPSVPVLAEKVNVSGAVASAETGQSSVDNLEVVAESKMFIAVQNNDYVGNTVVEPADTNLVAQPARTTPARQSRSGGVQSGGASVVEIALSSPKMALKTIFLTIGAVVLLVLILFVWIKPKRMHTKNVVFTILLLVLIAVVFYASSSFLFPQILVE